jgi:hypothetical protein
MASFKPWHITSGYETPIRIEMEDWSVPESIGIFREKNLSSPNRESNPGSSVVQPAVWSLYEHKFRPPTGLNVWRANMKESQRCCTARTQRSVSNVEEAVSIRVTPKIADLSGRARVCDWSLAGIADSNSALGHGFLSLVSVVRCQVEVSTVQRRPADCIVALRVIQKPEESGGPGPRRAFVQQTKKKKVITPNTAMWAADRV